MNYYTILTEAGLALEAAALAGEKSFTLSTCVLGDGAGEPDPKARALKSEVWRGALHSISRDEANPSWLVMEAHVPPEEGGFMVREFGIYTDDGVLFAVGNHPETYKPTLAEGSGVEMVIRPICAVSSAASVTLLIDPAVVMASRKYVDESIASSEEGLRSEIAAAGASASTILPLINGEAFIGSDTGFARGDHVHPVDTSRAAAVHTHGASDISGLAIPAASATIPTMNGTAKTGAESGFSRGDHVHPVDTSRAAASHTHPAGEITGLAIPTASAAIPAMNGTAKSGSDASFSRGDHVHPVDLSRAASVHTHTREEVLGLGTVLEGRAPLPKGEAGMGQVLNFANNLPAGDGTWMWWGLAYQASSDGGAASYAFSGGIGKGGTAASTGLTNIVWVAGICWRIA